MPPVLVRVLRDRRGSAQLEYLIAFAFVGLAIVAALAAVAPRVLRDFSAQRALLYQHQP